MNAEQSTGMIRSQGFGLAMLGVLLVLNLVQAYFTTLLDDEAFYWLFGQKLAWGYYEHPPMAGLMIRAGYALFHNELGVRLLFVLTSACSIWMMARLAGTRNYLLFFAIVFSIMIIQAGSFLATPDVALIVMTVAFLWAFRRYAERDHYGMAVLLGLIMALMIYSKYTGILVIFFAILSDLKLLKRPSFYLAAGSALLFFAPHMIWQYQHGYPTVYYHLAERSFSQHGFLKYVIEYVAGQVGILGPFMSLVMFAAIFFYKAKTPFDRTLKFIANGILAFFFLYAFRGKIEPNWTVPAVPAMIIIAYKALEDKVNWHKALYWVAGISFVLMMGLRVFLVYDYLHLPGKMLNLSELRYWKEWARQIDHYSGGRPVVFLNSYQRASKFSFYAGRPAYSHDRYSFHRTQFYYWTDMEEDLQGKDVMLVGSARTLVPGSKVFEAKNSIKTFYAFQDNFRSFVRVPVEIGEIAHNVPRNSELVVPVSILNPDTVPLRFDGNPGLPASIVYHLRLKGKIIAHEKPALDLSTVVINGPRLDTCIRIKVPPLPGEYAVWLSVKAGYLKPARNSHYKSFTAR